MATIAVRPHFYAGAALLALAALTGVLAALRPGLLPADVHVVAYLGGLTLFAEGIAFWYLPSFAKRAVILDGMASYAGPILFPTAALATALELGGVRAPTLALALATFPLVMVASALFGPRWRRGVPFWRTAGEHQRGDIAAAVLLSASLLWFAAAAVGVLFAPTTIVVSWPVALGVFALGALAHLVPRSRGRPALAPALLVAALAAQAGAVVATLARAGIAGAWTRAGYVLLAGAALAALAIAPPGRRKPLGPRGREAMPLLWAAAGALLLAVVAASAWPERTFGRMVTGYYALLAAVGLAMAGLSLLTMPVLFNQRPAGRLVLPTLLVFLAAATLLAASLITSFPRWPAAALLAATVLLWLATLAPLRTPRRDCPVPIRQRS